MPAIKSVIFCTSCRSFIKITRWPLPYSDVCPYCGYSAPLLRRRSCRGHDVASLRGLLVVTVHSDIGRKLLRLVSGKEVVAAYAAAEVGSR